MLSQIPSKERLLYVLVGAGVLFAFGFMGSNHLRARPSLKLEPASLPAEKAPESKAAVVHVVGAVKSPGLFSLEADDRVNDAIRKAGGALPSADLEAVNLAAKLADGTQLYVPRKGGTDAEKVVEVYKGGGSDSYRSRPTPLIGSTRATSQGSSQIVSLNSANQAQLESLPGVGPATAKKILDYRQATGGFSSVEELLKVNGIGPKKLAAMRKFVRL
jgi:competence protein ComEA